MGGLLAGCIGSAAMLAIMMGNAGGAWDNAKKLCEKLKLKKTEQGKACVIGDTVGDPFKDTSGPALNILIKLMTMISLVFGASVFKNRTKWDKESPWYVGVIIALGFMFFAVGLTFKMRAWGFGKIPDRKDDKVEMTEDFK